MAHSDYYDYYNSDVSTETTENKKLTFAQKAILSRIKEVSSEDDKVLNHIRHGDYFDEACSNMPDTPSTMKQLLRCFFSKVRH